MVPSRSAVGSRQGVDLSSPDGTGTTIPLVVANMTAIAGRRMAETVARRGGIVVIPQDIPIEVVTDVISWVKTRHHVLDTPITLAPTQTVADALSLLPKRAHGAGVVVDAENRPVGVVTDHDLTGVDRFTQLSEVMSKELLLIDADIDPRQAFNQLDAYHRKLAPAVDKDGQARRHPDPQGRAARDPVRAGRGRQGRAADRGRRRHQRRLRGQGQAAARRGRGHDRHRHRARPPGIDDQRDQGRPRAGPAGPDRGGQHRRGRGRQGPDRRRRGHHQGRCRPRRDVHHPHDDRRGPPAVLRGAGVRGRGQEVRQARVGRRRRPSPARRGDGPRGQAPPTS